jgi:hypothetical protein
MLWCSWIALLFIHSNLGLETSYFGWDFVDFLSSSSQTMRLNLKLDHDLFLAYSFQFIITFHYICAVWTDTWKNTVAWTENKNKYFMHTNSVLLPNLSCNRSIASSEADSLERERESQCFFQILESFFPPLLKAIL